MTGFYATASAPTAELPSSGALNTAVNPAVGSVGITGYSPVVSATANVAAAPGAGAIVITGLAPSVSQSASNFASPSVGVITVAGYSPSVSQSNAANVLPGAASIVVAGYAPSVSQSAAGTINIAPSAIVVNGYAPSIAKTANQWLAPGADSLSISGYAPVITQGATIVLQPSPGNIYTGNIRLRMLSGSRGLNYTPKRASEVEIFTVDYVDQLAPGETIVSAAWSCSIYSGSDSSVAAMVQGNASINGTQVSQLIGGGVPGVKYRPICTATTNLGQVKVLPEPGDGLLTITG
jgi:hypothetical protein